jgi:hypothetical protein
MSHKVDARKLQSEVLAVKCQPQVTAWEISAASFLKEMSTKGQRPAICGSPTINLRDETPAELPGTLECDQKRGGTWQPSRNCANQSGKRISQMAAFAVSMRSSGSFQ